MEEQKQETEVKESTAPAAGITTLDQIDYESFMKIELRVGEVVHAEAIPKSRKLLKLEVSLGDCGKRQILAGLAEHYEAETLIGKKIVVVANLKPAKLMGQESQGMLLAASPEDNSTIVLIQPAGDIAAGSRVR